MLPTRRSSPPPFFCSPAIPSGAFAVAAGGAGALLLARELNRPAEQEDTAQKASRKKLSCDLVFTRAILPSPAPGAADYFA
jgi:hypothetical protein